MKGEEMPIERKNPTPRKKEHIKAICAVLGIDIVSFSTLVIDDQLNAVRHLLRWVRSALDSCEIGSDQYHWSPAGDGGFLTFKTPPTSQKAIDVAFSIFEKTQRPTWIPSSKPGTPIALRFGLHAGNIEEGEELGGGTNIWGDGINMAARVLSICASSQVLVSTQYHDTYIINRQGHQQDFQFDDLFRRTVKHGVHVTVRNVRRGTLGLSKADEMARRWAPIGDIWKKAVDSYSYLIDDALDCANPIAALAASRFLLEMKTDSTAAEQKCNLVFSSIGETTGRAGGNILRHPIFNPMPPNLLKRLVRDAVPKLVKKETTLCKEGERAESCYFLVYGDLVIEGSTISTPIKVSQGDMIGEFSLWIPNIRRTASIRATDDSLVLEVPHTLFAELCRQSPEMANGVHANIKNRILDNVVRSPRLFPGLTVPQIEELKAHPTAVEKYPAGTKLSLKGMTYILFNGNVRVTPPLLAGKPHLIEARGHFGSETIIGIKVAESEGNSGNYPKSGEPALDAVDGEEAVLLEESVLVKISHETILNAQRRSRLVQEAWDGFWGIRSAHFLRLSRQPSSNTANRP